MKPFLDQMREFDDRRNHARIRDDELAAESGIPAATISRYRHGRQQPNVDRWVDMNNALDRLISRRRAALTRLAS